jgi:hypothetical protein
LYSPGLPPSASAGSLVRAPPFFRTSTGHRVEGRNPWHLQHSRHQLHAGTHFRRLVRSLSLRPSWLLASWADQTKLWLSLPQACTSGLPAVRSPCRLPDMTTAPNGELRRQDLHLQVQQLVSLRFPLLVFVRGRLAGAHSNGFLRKCRSRLFSCGEGAGRACMDDLVVAQEASPVESSSRLDFLLLRNLGMSFVAP